jgi:hypothetical protein
MVVVSLVSCLKGKPVSHLYPLSFRSCNLFELFMINCTVDMHFRHTYKIHSLKKTIFSIMKIK